MDVGLITRDVEGQFTITADVDVAVLEPEPCHATWANFVSQRAVRAIAVAPHSRLMWLATWGGVLSWNRKEPLYRRYSSEHGLAGNLVSCLCIDHAERPWAGHTEGGLSYFVSPYWRVYGHLQDEPIRAVCRARQAEGIWAAGEERVYLIADPEQEPTVVALEHDGAFEAQALLDDGDGLLLGNAWGLFRLRPGSEPDRVAAEAIQECTALAQDGGGTVWVGTPEAVYRLDGDTAIGPFGPGPSDALGRVLALSAGRRWVWALTTAGLAQVKAGRWIPVPWLDRESEPPAIQAIEVGTDDAYLWLGTDDLLMGVLATGSEVDWDNNLLPHHAEDKLNNLGRCAIAAHDGEQVWVGTAAGVVEFEPDDEWQINAGGDVRALAANPDGDGHLWKLAWPQGVTDESGARLPQPPGLPLALAIAQDGQPHVLTARGLWQLGMGQPQKRAVAAPAPPRCLAQMPGGQWWLGTVRGVYCLVDGHWELAGEQPGPVQAGVYALAVVDDTLWAATEAGLWARQGHGWLGHDVGSSLVRALAPSVQAGKLWVARADGIVRYDPASKTASQPYTPANSGLASRRVTALVERAGNLWIVTQAGVSRLKLADDD